MKKEKEREGERDKEMKREREGGEKERERERERHRGEEGFFFYKVNTTCPRCYRDVLSCIMIPLEAFRPFESLSPGPISKKKERKKHSCVNLEQVSSH